MQTTTATRPQKLKRPARPQGFNLLRQTDKQAYRSLKSIFDACMDRNDWAYLVNNGRNGCRKKLRANKKEQLNYWLDLSDTGYATRAMYPNAHKRIKTLSLIRIEDHCKGEKTLYYTSHPTSSSTLLMFDIDDKEGVYGDSEKVLDLFSYWFPSMFRQRSTFGKGSHGFIVVQYPDLNTANFRALCATFEKALAAISSEHGFNSKVELKGIPGNPNLWGGYVTCGEPAKIPRLSDHQHIQAFIEACKTVYYPSKLQEVIDFLPPVEPAPEATHETGEPDVLPSASLLSDTNMNTVFVLVSEEEKTKESRPTTNGNPCSRMNHWGWNLTRRLGRPATAMEIIRAYEAQHLNTGVDLDGNRWKLADESAKWCQKHYRPMVPKYDPESYIQLITQHIGPAQRKGTRRKCTDEQLAIVLWTIEQTSTTWNKNPKLQWTTPNNLFETNLARLNAPVEGESEAAIRQKIGTMKTILVNSGLAEVKCDRWSHGIGKRYVIGPANPRRGEYQKLRDEIDNQKSVIRKSA